MSTVAPSAVRTWLKAHDTHDPVLLLAALHDDVNVRSLFRSTPAAGKEEAKAHFEGVLRAFPDLVMPVSGEGFDSTADLYLAEVHFVGTFAGHLTVDGHTHRGGGERFDVTGVVCQHLRDGLIHTTATYFDRADWLTQIGLA